MSESPKQPKKMVILLIGPPASGKGSVSPFIEKHLQIPVLSTGDLLRNAVESGSKLGEEVKEIMHKGEFVSDELVINISRERMGLPDCKKGFVLDGMPRTIRQAQALDSLLKETGNSVTHVLEMCIPENVLYERVTSRWVHKKSGRSYNVQNFRFVFKFI